MSLDIVSKEDPEVTDSSIKTGDIIEHVEETPNLDSDTEDEEFRDALDRQMRELEEEGTDLDFQPKFSSLEEAKREIERVGEEYRLKHDLRKEESDQYHEAAKELEANAYECDQSDLQQEKAEMEQKEKLEEEELHIEERKRREAKMSDQELESLKAEAQNIKKEGNHCYLNKDNDEAIDKYTEALELCPLKFGDERSVFFANRAAAKVAKGDDESALEDCHKALELNPEYVKVLIRRGQLYEKMDKPHEAMKDFELVVTKLDKDHKEARAAVMRLPEKIAKKDEEIKKEMFGNLRKLGDMVLNPFGLSCNNFQFQKDESTGSYSVNFNQKPS